MKQLWIFLFVLAAFGCGQKSMRHNTPSQKPRYFSESRFLDSIKAMNPDHLIFYKRDCVGCFKKSEVAYYLWHKDGENHTIKIQDSVLYELKNAISLDDFGYFYDSIQHEKWNEPSLMMSHYHYEDFSVDFKNYHLAYKVQENSKTSNEKTYRVKFLSFLRFYINKQDSDWQIVF